MKKITLFITGLLILGSGAFAQKTHSNTISISGNTERCGTTHMMQEMRSLDPVAFDKKQAEQELQLQNWIANNYDVNSKKSVIIIPVVVQIWENTSTVPDIRVTQQIDRLNADFGRTNSDAGNTPGMFSAVDCEIQFCLATKDPNGISTNGIIRKTVGGTPASSGGSDLWNTTKYLNIYVYGMSGGLLGFTYLSSSPNNAVHVGTPYFGNTSSAPYNMGRTATHEVGHWLNLKHIWGDANCGNDFVNDTPTQQTSNGGCPSHPHVTCGNSGDMFMNYMDYVNDNCMNAFTAGQKARMIAAINNDRSGLLTSSATNCASLPIEAIFSANVTTINAGQTITFTESSTGPNAITSWNWNFDVASSGGVSPSTMGTQGAHVVTYNTAGTYSVSLQVGDGSSSDTETKTAYITVNPSGTVACDTVTSFTGTPTLLGSNIFGWVSGHNNYDDRAKANSFSAVSAGVQLTGVEMFFGKTHNGSGSGSINVVVWDNSGTAGSPGSVIHTQSAPINSLNLYPTITQFTFPSPVTVTGPYYVGIEISANTGNSTQDSVALITNADGETSPGTAWEQWSDASWHAYSETPDSWGVDMANAIAVQMCNGATSVYEEVNNTLINIYPNPSVGTINVALTKKVSATVLVYNMLGEEVYSLTKNAQLFTVDMNNQPNGVYFVKIKSGDSISTKKVILSK